MSVGDKDAAVWPDDHVVGLIELTVGRSGFASGAEAQQLLALRAELVDLMALGSFLVRREVRNPDVAVLVDGNAVRRDHDALAEVGEHLASAPIELEDRVDRRVVAIDRSATGR